MERKFLGWHKPLLQLAADYLLEHYAADGPLDLRTVTLVLPNRRAKLRLEEILASRAQTMDDPAWYPPELLTLESLPEKFYETKKKVAPEMSQWFAWIEAVKELRRTDPKLLKQLLPEMPKSFGAELSLGRMLARLHYELAAEGIDFRKIAEIHAATGMTGEASRWKALSTLQDLYANDDSDVPGFLDRRNLWDLQAARLYAINRPSPEEHERIVEKLKLEKRRFYLVGLVDMNELQKRIFERYSSFITPLVFAPEKLRHRFDRFGCLNVDEWYDPPLEIDDKNIDIAWQPENEADSVLRKIASLDGKYATGEMVVGVPDKQVVPFIQERFAQSGLPSRLVEGTSLRRTAVFRFLETLLKFLKGRHFRDYNALVRHPDVEKYVQKTVFKDYISQLDDYHNTFFPVEVDANWKNDPKYPWKFETLPLVWAQIAALIDVPASGKTPDKKKYDYWLRKIDALLERLYAGRQREQIRVALEIVRRTIESLRSIPDGLPQTFTFAEMLELLLAQVESERIAPPELPNAVELIGWLDMAMDDAPVAIVTGMNDGIVPSFANSDLFLPDALRKELGVMDNRRRCARDAYSLCVLLETRKERGEVLLVAGRRSTEGDPLRPSRFFFMSKSVEKSVERIRKFFSDMKPDAAVRLKRSLYPGQSDAHDFRVPLLPDLPEPIESFNVTELKGYLRCPYRYYLNKTRGLRSKDDSAEELPLNDFGTLAHRILQQFGEKNSPVRNSTSMREIRAFLDACLAEYAEKKYGKSPRAAIAIQMERAKARLHVFAQWQADWRRDGYEIVDVEFSPDDEHAVTLADKLLCGRIDRIDRHPLRREVVVFDYKTGKANPEEAYAKKKAEWKDFQLPLYHYILRKSGYAATDETIKVGYLPIPADSHEIEPQWAKWNDAVLQSGVDRAEEVIREILTTDWKTVVPTELSSNDSRWDDYGYICMNGLKQ